MEKRKSETQRIMWLLVPLLAHGERGPTFETW